MTLSEIESQLKVSGYTQEQIDELNIISMPNRFVKAFGLEVVRMAHILIVDGLLIKDRTGALKGKRIDITEIL
ncbi:hypothetical protein CPT_Michonne38 [Citrobacter phage Michonne]|uniref:Uncharacterized protein n=1 Tax=Citrobacter phage Michonne TaxID=1675603 RepID=A0A0K1LN93_9CAUD|nr:hypothetical protein CPT_Michonne_gp038 [Citrobacter phage Michonne]AKU43987.1 hypothetical protein CPT_Michonne38 [Citrobacter phage Michonne]AYR00782.1 hypothetical protein CPT_Maleficent_038 [Citrobacter phage Maleficent]